MKKFWISDFLIINVILLIFFVKVNSGKEEYNYQCLPEKGYVAPRFASPKKDPIVLQVSDRVTHQLTSRIYSIFLREVLGFQHVQLMEIEKQNVSEHKKLYDLLDNLVSYSWPVPTLDLEVWILSDLRSIQPEIEEAGALTSAGRHGWFIPSKLLTKSDLPSLLPYTMFQDTADINIIKQFAIDNDILKLLEPYIEKQYGNFSINGTYVPQNCVNKPCATLLSSLYIDTSFVADHINELKLRVKVIWFGANLKRVLNWLYNLYTKDSKYIMDKSKYLVLHWTPSEIIDGHIEYSMITMPRCEEMASSSRSGCKYELTPLIKYYAEDFKHSEYAVQSLIKVHFRSSDIKSMIQMYESYYDKTINNLNTSLTMNMMDTSIETEQNNFIPKINNLRQMYNDIACEWIKNNKDAYEHWIPIDDEKEDILIGGIFPLSIPGYKGIYKAAHMAEKAINDNDDILPNYNLNVLKNDGQCRPDIVMKTFINYYLRQEHLIGILGPACSETVEPIAGVSKHFRMAVISYSAEGASFADREMYPYFFRTIGENRQYENVYIRLLKRLNWNRVAALTEDGQKYTEYISHMETLLKKNDIDMILNKKFTRDRIDQEINRHLTDLKAKNAKIIIADINDNVVHVVMCEAYKLQMTAKYGYVWFLPVWLSKSWLNAPNATNSTRSTQCTESELIEAINGHFSLSHAPFADDNEMMQENVTVGEWRKNYTALCDKDEKVPPSDYAGFAYDAVWVYAYAVNNLIQEDPSYLINLHSERTTKRLMELILASDFQGVSGRIRFGEGASRFPPINVLQWFNGTSNIIGTFYPNISEPDRHILGGNLILDDSKIVWLSPNGKPDDGTQVCGLADFAKMLHTDCETARLTLISLLCCILVIIISAASFIFWKKKYDKKLEQSARYMKHFGIDLLSSSTIPGTALDKWEIPKDRVVINRRLGEGAFGTVYGGEAQINENGWTAVAVKTLKPGSSTEDRLDFLAEAEAMKRFEHKNIVKLLGVCLQTEPIYTIMEFMLYGDLKTFLLARRHLVNEKPTDDSDISPKRLTMMALDAARALSYLAERKYVHRDIACRNCLVNAQRLLKLGDFGMARPMFENDYYKFNRKGLLPVRWMSPESLGLGVFSPASDVWSYGVLLYEIITFGSFPFQGLTNNQVLEHIKVGNTLKIPNGVKPHLEGLMKACWNQQSKKRPTASEIAEYISNYPRLLSPCLDVPLASVEMADNSGQIELLPGLRKRSASPQVSNGLVKSATLNNLDVRHSYNNTNLSSIHLNNLNVPSDSTVECDQLPNGSASAYNPIEPLLRCDKEISKSNNSLRRYVPTCGFRKINIPPSPEIERNSISTSAL